MLRLLFWRGLTLIFLALAVLGAVLPGLPTTEFLLLAVWSSSHGWPAVNRWLLTHPKYGPMIQQWKSHQIMPRKAKVICCITMAISAYLLLNTGLAMWLKLSLISVMAIVLLWLLTRPEQVPHQA